MNKVRRLDSRPTVIFRPDDIDYELNEIENKSKFKSRLLRFLR